MSFASVFESLTPDRSLGKYYFFEFRDSCMIVRFNTTSLLFFTLFFGSICRIFHVLRSFGGQIKKQRPQKRKSTKIYFRIYSFELFVGLNFSPPITSKRLLHSITLMIPRNSEIYLVPLDALIFYCRSKVFALFLVLFCCMQHQQIRDVV